MRELGLSYPLSAPFADKTDFISTHMLELPEMVNQDKDEISRGRYRYDSKIIKWHCILHKDDRKQNCNYKNSHINKASIMPISCDLKSTFLM